MDIVLCSAKIEDYFRTVKDISAVYLFGSLVKGKARKNSDIDIAVLFTKGIPLLQRFERKLEIANDLEDLFEKKIDVVDLENADLYFIHQIMQNKKLIIDNDIHRRVAFEVAERREYFDRKPFYDLYHNQALKRLDERRRKYKNG